MRHYDSIVFVGDLCVSGEEAEKTIDGFDIWTGLRDAFGQGAAIVANLECPITDSTDATPYKWANLKSNPRLHPVLDGLAMAVLGNNHIGDFGVTGVRSTLAVLGSKGLPYAGYGDSLTAALAPAFIDVNGKTLGVVSLCCPTTNGENLATHLAAGVAPLGMATLRQAVEAARDKCDALVVYMHWGCEEAHDPAPDQLRLARQAIDCGADAVVGCHAHAIQGYEQYRGGWIFYGLGNYLFKAGFAQAFGNNGEMKRIPLTLRPANRESLAVAFRIQQGVTGCRLALVRIQPMRYADDLLPRPIAQSDLTFDLKAANNRLRAYVGSNGGEMTNRSEPVWLCQLKSGVLAYWYAEQSIVMPFHRRLEKLAIRMAGKSLRLIRRTRARLKSAKVAAGIALKWRRDKQRLPLTPAHRELYGIIHRLTWRKLGRFPDLVDCRDFNDRIQWLKLFDQSEEIIRCSDKVLVRDYVRERVGDRYLVKLYQVSERFSGIDFAALPQAFAIKTNHDSGTVMLVRDKAKLNLAQAEQRIEDALGRTYGWSNGEWAYSCVAPRVLVEEMLEPLGDTPPADYKFYCVEGRVKFCHFIYDRGADTKEQIVDPAGNDLATELYPSFKLGTGFSKPALWQEMLTVAERLGEGFKCVRVDMYCSEGRIYVGELTFWPMAGVYEGDGQAVLGTLLDFDRTTVKPLVMARCRG